MRKTDKRRVGRLPTASGGIARLACARAVAAGLQLEALLKPAGLSMQQIKNPNFRISVSKQIKLLELVAEAMEDEFLGFHLAREFDLREIGLLYYVQSSSKTFGDALRRLSRYSALQNEGVRIGVVRRGNVTVTLEYVGVTRINDRHQIEFFVTSLVRIGRELTGRRLVPSSIRLVHRRPQISTDLKALFGCDIAFNNSADAIVFPKSVESLPLVGADFYLNSLLSRYCEEAISARRVKSGTWRTRVENVLAPLLPYDDANVSEISQRLGVSERTLARRLASEGLTFARVVDDLRLDLAKRYLREPELSIAKIAWLLGYRQLSSFCHAFKRRTGKTPTQSRGASELGRGMSKAGQKLPIHGGNRPERNFGILR